MSKLTLFQQNNLRIGTDLAAEISSTSPERRAFVVIGAYAQTPSGPRKPSKFLNAEQENLRFWLRKYEVDQQLIDQWITDRDLHQSIYVENIPTLEQLEQVLEQYLQDFSCLEVVWKVDHPFP